MNDLISRLSEIRSNYNCMDENDEPYYRALSEAIQLVSAQPEKRTEERTETPACDLILQTLKDAQPEWLPPADTDLSAYSDKLWRAAYERGKREAEAEQGDEAIFWKKRAREYEDIIAGFVAEQAKGIKFDSITITEEGITFKKSQPERTGKWIRISPAKIYECSICGKNVMTADIDEYHFCHGCGARMEETT